VISFPILFEFPRTTARELKIASRPEKSPVPPIDQYPPLLLIKAHSSISQHPNMASCSQNGDPTNAPALGMPNAASQEAVFALLRNLSSSGSIFNILLPRPDQADRFLTLRSVADDKTITLRPEWLLFNHELLFCNSPYASLKIRFEAQNSKLWFQAAHVDRLFDALPTRKQLTEDVAQRLVERLDDQEQVIDLLDLHLHEYTDVNEPIRLESIAKLVREVNTQPEPFQQFVYRAFDCFWYQICGLASQLSYLSQYVRALGGQIQTFTGDIGSLSNLVQNLHKDIKSGNMAVLFKRHVEEMIDAPECLPALTPTDVVVWDQARTLWREIRSRYETHGSCHIPANSSNPAVQLMVQYDMLLRAPKTPDVYQPILMLNDVRRLQDYLGRLVTESDPAYVLEPYSVPVSTLTDLFKNHVNYSELLIINSTGGFEGEGFYNDLGSECCQRVFPHINKKGKAANRNNVTFFPIWLVRNVHFWSVRELIEHVLQPRFQIPEAHRPKIILQGDLLAGTPLTLLLDGFGHKDTRMRPTVTIPTMGSLLYNPSMRAGLENFTALMRKQVPATKQEMNDVMAQIVRYAVREDTPIPSEQDAVHYRTRQDLFALRDRLPLGKPIYIPKDSVQTFAQLYFLSLCTNVGIIGHF
jgi:hypothetical protein